MRHPAVINRRGSPPRAWGQSVIHVALQRRHRFTPTGVGTIGGRRITATLAAVHPHGRGDNDAPDVIPAIRRGSPPRAWGQCGGSCHTTVPRRFTPTGVGTMRFARFAHSGPSVHPHGRGDNMAFQPVPDTARGSPPRAWGQSIVNAGEDRNLRFTPTGVGTIRATSCATGPVAVHPHGRGDNRDFQR